MSEIDLTDPLNDNSGWYSQDEDILFLSLSSHLDAVSVSSNNSNEISGDFTDSSHPPLSATSSGSGSTLSIPETIENLNNYSTTIEINDSGKREFPLLSDQRDHFSSGVCCEKGEKYAIYVISISCKPLGNHLHEHKREWITYRRFSEFNDLDITIKKRYPDLRQYVQLPSKSLINNTSPDVRVKRQKELTDYLTVRMDDFKSMRKINGLISDVSATEITSKSSLSQ